MNPIEQRTLDILNHSSEIIRELPNSGYWLDQINDLKTNVHTKCTLAVGGRVKAGKSTFINALLGENLALVGTTETTATINRFVFGKPLNPQKPVKVVYKNGNVSYESQAFMDSFQGNDAKTMALSKGILYFERAIENPILKEIDLVDTPGTGAVVDEHQGAAESAFGIKDLQELRKEHSEQTQELVKKADAVIYLVGAVATRDNKEFMDAFQQACDGSSALNAIGLMSCIDIDEKVLYNSKEQADYVANSLKEQLSGVMPVSAALYQAVQQHASSFEEWQQFLKSIQKETLEELCDSNDAAWNGGFDDDLREEGHIVPDLSYRKRMQKEMGIPWSAFRAIINILYRSGSAEEAIQKIYELSNFGEVKRVLEDQFFARAKAIKCTVLLSKLNKILWLIRNDALYSLKRSAKKSEDWIRAVDKNIRPTDSSNAEELTAFIRGNIKSQVEIDRIEKAITTQLVQPLEVLMLEIKETNMDYKMLQEVHRMKDSFGQYYEELCTLFGMYGTKPQISNDEKMQRQMFWQNKAMRYMDRKMQEVAYYAASAYGKL